MQREIEERYEVTRSTITGSVTITLPAPGLGRHYLFFEADGYLKGGTETDIEMTFALGLNTDPKLGDSGFPAGGARTLSYRSMEGMRSKENSVVSVTVTSASGGSSATVNVLRLCYAIRKREAGVEPMLSGASSPAM